MFGARAGHLSYLRNSLHTGGSNTNQGGQGPPSASDLVFLMLFTVWRKEGCSLFAPTGRQCLVCTSVHRQAGRGVCDVQIGWCSQYSFDCTVVFQKEETPNNIVQQKVFPELHNCWILCWRSRNSDKLISGNEARPSREKFCTLHACAPPKPPQRRQKHFNFFCIKINVLVIVQGTLLN